LTAGLGRLYLLIASYKITHSSKVRKKMEPNAFAEFWRQLPPGAKIHPADKPILDAKETSLEFGNMPAFGAGPLATASVVLCYLNNRPISKLSERDRDWIIKQEKELGETWGEYLAGVIEGDSRSEPRPLTEWGRDRIKHLNPELENTVATFNIVPYRSPSFADKVRRLTPSLPSAQMARNYLHEVLLPDAARGERFVVVGWGPRLWSVPETQAHATLFVQLHRRGSLGKDLSGRINAWWANR